MNKTCARCSKVVYPIEELKCLDKIWHKTCFKCHECGMTLNMKTYKGFNKLPYCEAHIPKAKATAIADTPELKRIAENTKIQSNFKYHEEFEKQKGKHTQVADDPETLRIKQNTKHISNVAYHGDLEKKAAMEKQRGTSEFVEARDNESEYFSEALAAEQLSQYQTTQPQQAPIQQQQQPISSATSHAHQYHQTNMHQQQQQQQPTSTIINSQQQHNHQPVPQVIAQNNSQSYSGMMHQQQQQSNSQQQLHQQQQQMQNYQKVAAQQQQQQQFRQTSASQHQSYASQQQQLQQQQQQSQQSAAYQGNVPANSYMQIRSSILQNAHHPSGGLGAANNDMSGKYYDQYETYARPTSNAQIAQNSYNNNNNPSVYNNAQTNYMYNNQGNNSTQYNANTNGGGGSNGSILAGGIGVMGGSTNIGKIADYDPLTDGPRNIPNTSRQSATLIYSSDRGAVNSNSNPRRVGSIADIDPANGVYGSVAEPTNPNQYYQQQNQLRQQQQQQQQHSHHHQTQQQQSQQNHQTKSNLRVYRALYDYEAQDIDEVSFKEGDLIFEIESIDSGWMTGKVERTGKTGMLPANYVQPAMI